MHRITRDVRFGGIAVVCSIFNTFFDHSVVGLICDLSAIGMIYFNRDLFKEYRGLASERIMLPAIITIAGLSIQVLGMMIIKAFGIPHHLILEWYRLVNAMEWLAIAVVLDDKTDEGGRKRGGINSKMRELVERIKSVHGSREPIRVPNSLYENRSDDIRGACVT